MFSQQVHLICIFFLFFVFMLVAPAAKFSTVLFSNKLKSRARESTPRSQVVQGIHTSTHWNDFYGR